MGVHLLHPLTGTVMTTTMMEDQSHLTYMESTHGGLISSLKLTKENFGAMHLKLEATNGMTHYDGLVIWIEKSSLICNLYDDLVSFMNMVESFCAVHNCCCE